jgi:hypothetical protein
MAKPNLALIPATIGDKVYSILPSDGVGDFDFTRADGSSPTGVTRINAQGLIEQVASGVNRLNYSLLDGEVVGCPHLLLEPARVNRQVYSEQIDDVVWSKVNTTVTANQIISPSGEYNADKVQRTSTSSSYITDSASKSASSQLDITTSMFVKKGEGDFFAIRQQGIYPNRGEVKYQFSTNTITTSVAGSDFTVVDSSVEDYGNGWIRLSATFNTDAHSTVGTLFSPRATDGTVDASDTSDSAYAYVWGVQVEEGSYPTSYIKTTNQAVTRAAETCNGSGNAATFNDSEGVLMAEISALDDDLTFRTITISDSSTSNNVGFGYRNNSNSIYTFLKADINSSSTVTVSDIKDFNKVAVKYKSGSFAMWINGFEQYTSSTAFSLSGLSELAFDNGVGAADFYGKTKQIQYFDSVLDSEQLEQLTSWDSFRAMAEGQLYTIE